MLRSLYDWTRTLFCQPKAMTFNFEKLPHDIQNHILKFRSPHENASTASISKTLNQKQSDNILWNEFLKPEYQAKDKSLSTKQIYITSPLQRLDQYRPTAKIKHVEEPNYRRGGGVLPN